MNMVKSSFCIFTLAVLVCGASCGSGFLCILQELLVITPDHFFSSPIRACQNIEFKFNQARKGLKDCTKYPIDTSELQNLYNEFCDSNSDYRKKFNRQEFCLHRNTRNSLSCMSSMQQSKNLTPDRILSQSTNDMCHTVSVEVSSCLRDKVGKPCGAEGEEVYGRITKASEPFFKGTCLAAAENSLGETNTLDEISKAEHSIVEATVTEGYSDSYSGAAVSSAFLWCILLGLLFAVKWW